MAPIKWNRYRDDRARGLYRVAWMQTQTHQYDLLWTKCPRGYFVEVFEINKFGAFVSHKVTTGPMMLATQRQAKEWCATHAQAAA